MGPRGSPWLPVTDLTEIRVGTNAKSHERDSLAYPTLYTARYYTRDAAVRYRREALQQIRIAPQMEATSAAFNLTRRVKVMSR